MTIRVEIDGVVDTITSAFPDMETYELVELETAINAELQQRYQDRRPVLLCTCEACNILRGNAHGA